MCSISAPISEGRDILERTHVYCSVTLNTLEYQTTMYFYPFIALTLNGTTANGVITELRYVLE